MEKFALLGSYSLAVFVGEGELRILLSTILILQLLLFSCFYFVLNMSTPKHFLSTSNQMYFHSKGLKVRQESEVTNLSTYQLFT